MVKKRILTGVLIVISVAALLGSGFSFGYKAGRSVPENVIVKGISNTEEGKPADVDFGTFWQAWKEIDSIYLRHEEVGTSDRVYGAIKGLIGSLGDPYSEFFKPDENKKFQEDIQGSFGGIGAELGVKDGQVVVVSPLKNSPAMKAGLEPGDKILMVDSSSTLSVSVDQAVKWIRGPVGKEVKLTILKDGAEKTKEVKIIRAVITIPTLETDMLDGNIAHVKLFSFTANAPRLFYDAMFDVLNKGAKGMIFDLRNDPGGYLEVSVDLAGWFLPRGSLVVSQEGRDGQKQDFRAVGNEALKDFPIVILVNKGTASASEILAGAIRAHRDKVKLIGETTFGKGTVQELRDLRDGSSIKLTVAHWVLPDGHILEGKGLEPDIALERTEQDFEKNKDPQLDKAIEVLKAQL